MEYFHQLLCKKSHPSHIWNTLKLATASSALPENWPSFNSNNPSSIANTLNSYFTSVSSSILNPDHPPPSAPSLPHPTLSLHPATPEWCENALAALKPNCATGLDQLPSAALIADRTVISYPLCSIINSSIARSVFPTPWKCAIIMPVHKGGDGASPTNYRPISLLPVPSKVLEKHIHIQLSQYLVTHNLLYPLQSGFRPSHSTQTLLLHCLDKWYKALDTKKYVGAVFLDISKAFDIVSHELLLSKLTNLGLSSTATSWFRSYLSNRSQITRVLNSYSSSGFPSSGVPQGSILGPTLFSAFIYDLPSVLPLNSTIFSLLMIQPSLYIVSDDICSLQSSLQTCLNLANLWLQRNGLRLNTLKTKCMLIHSSRKLTGSTLELSVDGSQVEQVRSFKFLGVTINDTLTWSDHTVYAKVSCNLNLLHRLSWFLPQPLLHLLFKSYILPLFDYCLKIVWSGCTKSEASRLETLLNYACCTVLCKRRGSSALAACRELGLSTLASRRKLHLALTMFNCMSSKSPPYLSQLLPLPSSHYNMHSALSSQLNLSPNRSSFGQKSFSFIGAALWRSLPPNIWDTREFNSFYSLCQHH